MLTDLIINVFAGKSADAMEPDQLKRQAISGTISGGITLAVVIPALQVIISRIEDGTLIEKIPGAVNLIGTALIAVGFYMLIRGIAFYLALKKSSA